jgi:NAD dependent epimerase/dehydratase family
MRIFLAGASGVIGQRLIPRLIQAGHVVGGLTRSPSKTELLSHLGAEPILCDVFDREALIRAVRDFKPDVILNELTNLPDDVAQISEHAGLNARIRTEGNRNLIEAARQSGSPKILAQTVAWRLPDGPDALAVAGLERSVLAEGGVVLRYGQFYGPAPITSRHPWNPEFTSTERPNEQWRRWARQRAWSSLSTERATASRPTVGWLWHISL